MELWQERCRGFTSPLVGEDRQAGRALASPWPNLVRGAGGQQSLESFAKTPLTKCAHAIGSASRGLTILSHRGRGRAPVAPLQAIATLNVWQGAATHSADQ